MKTGRLEAFSDGVIAIIITIMVLEMKAPAGSDFSALKPLIPKFIFYVLSFIYVGIYWNNHHHLFQAIQKVNGKVLWTNLTLLFGLSMIPFTNAWMGEHMMGKNPVALYSLNLLFCAVAFMLLERAAISHEGKESAIGRAMKGQRKEMISVLCYALAFVLSFYIPIISMALIVTVAALWLIPDRRIEKQLE